MNKTLSDMFNCLDTPGRCTDMSVLDNVYSSLPIQAGRVQSFEGIGEMVIGSVKPDPGLENGWSELGKLEMSSLGFGSSGNQFEINCKISTTSSCPPATMEVRGRELEKMSSKKRKTDKVQKTNLSSEDVSKDKRIEVDTEEEGSKETDQNSTKNNSTATNRETSAATSKRNSKPSEAPKTDYIHVRARRGQATDSHSLAERVRREKISERMKYLQDLVPGCNKITGKAGMLDEIINYVQSLQGQVEFLSMKLAAANPTLDFNINDLFPKEVLPIGTGSFPTIGMSSEMTNPAYLQLSPTQQLLSFCDPGLGLSHDTGLRRTISAPISIPETFTDSCFAQIQPPSTWDTNLQSLNNAVFDQERLTTFLSQQSTGSFETSNLKMAM